MERGHILTPCCFSLHKQHFAFRAAASSIINSLVHAAAPGKPPLLPRAVIWWMCSTPLAQPWEQLLPWVSEQGLPCSDTAPHCITAQPHWVAGGEHYAITKQWPLIHSQNSSFFFFRQTLLPTQSLFLCDSLCV